MEVSGEVPSTPGSEVTQIAEKTTVLERPQKPSTREAIAHPELFSWDKVLPQLIAEKDKGKTIVATNGHFVLFHPGHSISLEMARQVGIENRLNRDDNGVVLLAIVNTDQQTTSKDPKKGVAQPSSERALNIFDNRHSDFVVISGAPAEDSTVTSDINTLANAGVIDQNFIYIKGGDYGTDANVPPEAQIVLNNGGKFKVVERVGDYSTSRIVASLGSSNRS